MDQIRLEDYIELIKAIGWIGSVLFSLCALPQCIKCWRTQKAGDLSWWFLSLWGVGEICTFAYVLLMNMIIDDYQWPLLANYVANFLLLLYLLYAKTKYK